MKNYVVKDGRRLKCGITTGSCAAAATKAAAEVLLRGSDVSEVSISLPNGDCITLPVRTVSKSTSSAVCSVIKDAGDDPDVTNGLEIVSEVSLTKSGIEVEGGNGVGTVTKKGLQVEVGRAAINPVPYKMIEAELKAAIAQNRTVGGLRAVISVPGGEEAAKRTFNPRLGIKGGISILGTSGIVEPMSEKALVDTIKAEIDIARARGGKNIVICPGNYGVSYFSSVFGLGADRIVKCSNFIGETLDYAVYCGFTGIVIAGHAGKLIKLAAGIMNTHSRVADGKAEILAAHAAANGADKETVCKILETNTVEAAFQILEDSDMLSATVKSASERIKFHLAQRTGCGVEFAIFRNDAELLYISDERRIREIIGEIIGEII